MAILDTVGKRIMQRVYYTFAVRIMTHPVTIHALLFVGSVFVLSRLTHVAAIVSNLKSVRVGELDVYLYSTFMQAEFLTLVCVGIIVFTLLSLPIRLVVPSGQKRQLRSI